MIILPLDRIETKGGYILRQTAAIPFTQKRSPLAFLSDNPISMMIVQVERIEVVGDRDETMVEHQRNLKVV